MKTILTFVFLITTSNAFAESKLWESVSSLYTAVNALAQTDLVCSSNDDCSSLALGSRACGGPNGYVVYSKNNSSSNELVSIAANLEAVENRYNNEAGIFSICSFEMPPEVACQKNICVAK